MNRSRTEMTGITDLVHRPVAAAAAAGEAPPSAAQSGNAVPPGGCGAWRTAPVITLVTTSVSSFSSPSSAWISSVCCPSLMPRRGRTRCSLPSTFSHTWPNVSGLRQRREQRIERRRGWSRVAGGAAALAGGPRCREGPDLCLPRSGVAALAFCGRRQAACAHAFHESLALFGRHVRHPFGEVPAAAGVRPGTVAAAICGAEASPPARADCGCGTSRGCAGCPAGALRGRCACALLSRGGLGCRR